MGKRKKESAKRIKEAKAKMSFAILRNCPSSPRKMRLVADMVRGMEVMRALDVLKYNSREASGRVEKLLRSAIANWEQKNEGAAPEESGLFIKEIKVDEGRMLKRLQPAPQGRAHRIRKRSNHVTLILGSTTDNNING